jgi:hypothetical protein
MRRRSFCRTWTVVYEKQSLRPTPLGFVPAASKELTACCCTCASTYATLHATRSPACNARSPAHAATTLHDCNVTESPTPLGFVLAASKELTACCCACASAYATVHATRSPACNARSPAHAHRSTDERNLPESTALHGIQNM